MLFLEKPINFNVLHLILFGIKCMLSKYLIIGHDPRLVESFLLDFLKPPKIVLLNGLLFFLCQYDVCEVSPVYIDGLT